MEDICIFGNNEILKERLVNPIFVCVISYTATCEIAGITVAGASPDLLKFTSPADSEFLYYGRCKCVDTIPVTPDGKPTPALITRVALKAGQLPVLIVDAGARIKPSIPYISFGLQPGRNIVTENTMDVNIAMQAFEFGVLLGKQLAALSDMVILGESIAGGTTTALAVLCALGIDAKFKISSSMPKNPHELKNEVVASALERAGIISRRKISALEAVASVGDPMMPSVAGIAHGATASGCRVMLAGGTQMTAIVAILKNMGKSLKDLCIGTTSYVANDSSSDLRDLLSAIAPQIPILSCELHLNQSSKPGLQAFAKGFVKEGVGAGGTCLATMIKSGGNITGTWLMKAIEKEYENFIEMKHN
jgi:uncharacterized protein (TIGR00303 family)